MLTLIALLAGCAPSEPEDASEREPKADDSPDTTPEAEDPVEEPEEEEPEQSEGEDVEGIGGSDTGGAEPEEDPSWMFQLDQVYEAELTIDPADMDLMEADSDYVAAADLVFDGRVLPDIGVRIKGRLGSKRDFSGKPALKLDLNYHDPEQDLDGLERLNFNNMVQDSSMAHERVAYALYNAAGVAAPRVGYVWLTINGEVYGLYTNVEVYDDEWLEKNYADPNGNLYDGDYFLHESGSYTLVDFEPGSQSLFVLDEGADNGRADIYAVTAARLAGQGTPDLYADLDAVVDMDQFLRLWAVDVWIGQYDGYVFNRNNYRVYFDPADGRMRMHPWDPDWAFYSSTPIGSPYGALASACWAEATCKAEFLARLADVKATADSMGLLDELGQILALIPPYVDADPRKEASTTSIQYGQKDLNNWIKGRSAQLTSMGY